MRYRVHHHFRVNGEQRRTRGFRFVVINIASAQSNLTLQVGEVCHITIAEGDVSYAAGGQIKCCGRPQTTGSDNKDVSLSNKGLTLYAYFIE